jgi:hypothetical protein
MEIAVAVPSIAGAMRPNIALNDGRCAMKPHSGRLARSHQHGGPPRSTTLAITRQHHA